MIESGENPVILSKADSHCWNSADRVAAAAALSLVETQSLQLNKCRWVRRFVFARPSARFRRAHAAHPRLAVAPTVRIRSDGPDRLRAHSHDEALPPSRSKNRQSRPRCRALLTASKRSWHPSLA